MVRGRRARVEPGPAGRPAAVVAVSAATVAFATVLGLAVLLLAGCQGRDVGVAASGPGARSGSKSGSGSMAGSESMAGSGSRSGTQRYPLGVTRYPSRQRIPLPTLSAATLTGETFSTAGPGGTVMVLNVWASWCEPCRTESPVVAQAARRWATAGVRFVGLDENDPAPAAKDFARSVGFDHPQLVDDGVLLGRLSAWLPDAAPATLVVDRQGLVAARVVGPVTAAQLDQLLSEVTGS